MKQPFNILPDISDTSLVASWFNYKTGTSLNSYSKLNTNLGNSSIITLYDNPGISLEAGGGVYSASAPNIRNSIDNEITVSFWYNPDFSSYSYFYMYQFNIKIKILLRVTSTACTLRYYTGSSAYTDVTSSSFASIDKKWTLVTATISDYTISGFNVNFYINGEHVSTHYQSATLYDGGADDIYIGSAWNVAEAYSYYGKLKDFRIYNEAKSEDWIKNEYQKSVPDDSLKLSIFTNEDNFDTSKFNHQVDVNSGVILGKDGAYFDGSSYLGLDTTLTSEFNSKNRTVSLWMIPDSDMTVATTGLFSKASAQYYHGLGSSYRFISYGASGLNYSDANGWVRNSWQHIVFTTYDDGVNSTYKYFVNGELFDTVVSAAQSSGSGIPILIGTFDISSTYKFKGYLKDLKFYNETKSEEWVKNEYSKVGIDHNLEVFTTNGLDIKSYYSFLGSSIGSTIPGGNKIELKGDGCVVLKTSSNLAPLNNLSSYTISAWAKITSYNDTYGIIVERKDANVDYNIRLTYNSTLYIYSSFYDALNNAVQVSSLPSGLDYLNDWHCIVFVADNSNLIAHLYIDGELINSISVPNGIKPLGPLSSTGNPGSNIVIGSRQDGSGVISNELIGEVKNVGLWLGVKSPSWIKNEYLKEYKQSIPNRAQSQSIFQPYDSLPDKSDETLLGAWLNKVTSYTVNDYLENINGTNYGSGFEKVGNIFNKTNLERIYFNSSEFPNLTVSGMTIFAWIKTDDTTQTKGIVKRGGNTGAGLSQQYNLSINSAGNIGSTIADTTYSDVAQTSSVPYNDGLWHNIVLTIDFNNLVQKIYVDTSLEITSPFSEFLDPSLATVSYNSIGSLQSTNYTFDGNIKDVRIYQGVKDLEWVQNEYKKSVPDTSLVGYWLNPLAINKDISIYENHGEQKGGTIYGSEYAIFNGTDSYILLEHTDILGLGSEATWSFWYKRNTVGSSIYPIKRGINSDAAYNNEYYISVSVTGNITVVFGDGSSLSSIISTTGVEYDNTDWHHVAVTLDASNNVIIYHDNILKTTGTKSVTYSNVSTQYQLLGSVKTNADYSDGYIRNLKMFNEAKSVNWIKNEYEKGLRGLEI